MINLKDYNIPSLRELLKRAAKDSDAASFIYFGERHPGPADFAVIIVKGAEQVEMTAQALERLKLYTPGKPIEDGMPMHGTEIPPPTATAI